MKPYDAVPFTNEFGQVIQPGQSCVIVAKGRSGGISTYRGRYLGVRTTKNWRGPKQQVVAEVADKKGGYIHPVTGQPLSYDAKLKYEAEHPGVKLQYGRRPCTRTTNLWLNLIYPSEFS